MYRAFIVSLNRQGITAKTIALRKREDKDMIEIIKLIDYYLNLIDNCQIKTD